jgi:SAM-dependent methyltransferase
MPINQRRRVRAVAQYVRPVRKSVSIYRPFSKNTEFVGEYDGNGLTCLYHSGLNYRIDWPAPFHPPRSAILMCKYLDGLCLDERTTVLDVGTGSTAILGIHSAMLGAGHVIGIDSDERAIVPARRNVTNNSLGDKLSIEREDVFTYRCENKFDFVVGNLPFMPAETYRSLYDAGGPNGRVCIIALLKLALRCLAGAGTALFLAPDYLGVNRQYGKEEDISRLAARLGLRTRIERMYKMEVRAGSYTARNLEWIKSVYPRYRFGTTRTRIPTHYLFVVSAKREPQH